MAPPPGVPRARGPPRSLALELASDERTRAEEALAGLCSELRVGEGHALGEYLRASPLCAELFGLWEGRQDGESGRVTALVLEVVAEVLEGHFQEDAQTARTRAGVAGRVLSERLQALCKLLSSERDQLLRLVLRVLAGVSSQSPVLSAQLLRTFNFAHEDFVRLVGRRMQASSKVGAERAPDVRTFYIRFALSFLRWKDSALTASAVSIKNFIAPILNGLKYDQPQDAMSFLNDITELLLRQPHVPRHAKLFFFNAYALRHICALLASEELGLAERAEKLLTDLCTDTSLFRAPKQQILLLDMCLDLRPLHSGQQRVILAILRAHPVLQFSFSSRLSLRMEPCLSWQWLSHVRFLTDLLDMDAGSLPAEAARAARGREQGEMELRASWMLQALVPGALKKTLLTQAVLHKNLLVVLAACRLLTALLERVEKALAAAAAWPEELRRELLHRVQQSLPELNTLLLCWQRLAKEVDPSTAGQLLDGCLADSTDLDASHLPELIKLPEGGLETHAVFADWCTTLRKYAEVLPMSTLDVKFDWTKLFMVVVEPLLQVQDTAADCLPRGVLERVLPCIACVGTAMRSSGRTQTTQMSRSQLAWVEGLLRVHASKALGLAGEHAPAIRSACEDALRHSLRHLAMFGIEEDAEILAWMVQLQRRPSCIAFFCQTLHTVVSKPGTLMTLLHSTLADVSEGGPGSRVQTSVPSLFLVAALRQLAQKTPRTPMQPSNGNSEKQSSEVLRCCRLVKALVSAVAVFFPHMTRALARLVEQMGQWGPEHPGNLDGDGSSDHVQSSGAEVIRQALLAHLAKFHAHWAQEKRQSEKAAHGKAGAKRRKIIDAGSKGSECVASCAKAIQTSLQTLAGGETGDLDVGCNEEAEPATSTLAVLRHKVAHCREHSACWHCGAYSLLEGVAVCTYAGGNDSLRCWYLIILIDLVPVIAAATSQVVEHTLCHPIWPELVSLAVTRPGAGGLPASRNLCLALAFRFLHSLLEACDRPRMTQEEAARFTHVCRALLLPLWQHVSFDAQLKAEYDKLTASGEGQTPRADVLKDDMEDSGAQSIIRLFSRFSMLEELVSAATACTEQAAQIGFIAALLRSQTGSGSTRPTFLQLSAQRRVELLRTLASAAITGKGLGSGRILRDVFTLDRAGFLRFALTATAQFFWPEHHGENAIISSDLVPLLEQACWVNPALRHDVIQRLSWSTCEPRAVLRMALSLAPSASSLPFLNGSALESVDPRSLLPLPPRRRLSWLLALHPSPALSKLLGRASAAEGGPVCRQSLALEVEVRRGAGPQIERSLLRLLAQQDAAVAADEGDGAHTGRAVVREVCGALRALGPSPSRPSGAARDGLEGLEALEAHAGALGRSAPEAAAELLSCLLERAERAGVEPPAWQRGLAGQLLESAPAHLEDWLLAHAARWWRHGLRSSDQRRGLVARIRGRYTASLASVDRCCRQILLDDAESRAPSGPASIMSADPWSFQHWCGLLPAWGDSDSWTWVFDQQRLKATLDSFCYDRPMRDSIPWAHGSAVNMPSLESMEVYPGESSSSKLGAVYDVGYVAPFLAGQLRTQWIESRGAGVAESRRVLAPVLSAVASGGTLELLLLACACADSMIRASAHEALSVVAAMTELWSETGADPDDKAKTRMPFKELPEIIRLLRSLRDAIEAPREGGVPPPVPRPVASVLCACVQVLFQQQHFLYLEIGNFLLNKAWLILSDIPLFGKLLLSGIQQSHEARVWLFRAIRRGIAGDSCSWCGSRASCRTADADQQDATSMRGLDGGGDGYRLTRYAMATRHVVEWLLSFAGSHELGSFALWSEAVLCLEALVAGPAEGTVQRFGIAEWVAGQASRQWTGVTGQEHQLQALKALLRLLEVILGRAPGLTGAELLNLSAAVRVVLQRWLDEVGADAGQQSGVIVTRVWLIALRLAELARVDETMTGGAASGVSFHNGQYGSSKAAWTVQLSGVLHLLSTLAGSSTGGADSLVGTDGILLMAGILSQRIEWHNLFMQCLVMLEVSPMSTVLHGLIQHLARNFWDSPLADEGMEDGRVGTAGTGWCKQLDADHESGNRQELASHAAENAILALGSLLWAVRENSSVDAGLHGSISLLLYTMSSLPYPPRAAWRVQVLVCCVLLALNPGAGVDAELLARLPGPGAVLAEAAGLAGDRPAGAESRELLAAAGLLGQVLSACDGAGPGAAA